jgi:hypothetical protein
MAQHACARVFSGTRVAAYGPRGVETVNRPTASEGRKGPATLQLSHARIPVVSDLSPWLPTRARDAVTSARGH